MIIKSLPTTPAIVPFEGSHGYLRFVIHPRIWALKGQLLLELAMLVKQIEPLQKLLRGYAPIRIRLCVDHGNALVFIQLAVRADTSHEVSFSWHACRKLNIVVVDASVVVLETG